VTEAINCIIQTNRTQCLGNCECHGEFEMFLGTRQVQCERIIKIVKIKQYEFSFFDRFVITHEFEIPVQIV